MYIYINIYYVVSVWVRKAAMAFSFDPLKSISFFFFFILFYRLILATLQKHYKVYM